MSWSRRFEEPIELQEAEDARRSHGVAGERDSEVGARNGEGADGGSKAGCGSTSRDVQAGADLFA